MKPASFRYLRPRSLDEALTLLGEHGYDAKVLAGGQSLVPAMNFRLAQPAVLVDLNEVPGLDGITAFDGGVRVGATDLQANGWLFILGGANGNPSNGNDTSTEIFNPGDNHGTWDSLGGGAMQEPRIHMGSTKESAFFFIVGGEGETGAALDSIEQTIQ